MRNRVTGMRMVKASELHQHPANWRRHGREQRKGLRAMLESVGFAGAALAYEDADGNLVLMDGHLRAEEAVGAEIPVLVTDLTPEEAELVLATYDPLGLLATPDTDALSSLVAGVKDTGLEALAQEDVGALLEDISETLGLADLDVEAEVGAEYVEGEPYHTEKFAGAGVVSGVDAKVKVWIVHLPEDQFDLHDWFGEQAQAQGVTVNDLTLSALHAYRDSAKRTD